MSRRQIVFYSKQSGRVLKTSVGGTISERKQILNYLPGVNLNTIAFYYEHDDAEVIPKKDLILFLHNGLPPYLCDSQRRPKTILLTIQKTRALIEARKKIKADFEFGMGDQVMQLEAYKKFKKEMPHIEFLAGIDSVYKNIYPYLSPKPTLTPWGSLPQYSSYYRLEMNNQHILWDPRGGIYGKACLFGSYLGLDEVHENINFAMPPQDLYRWAYIAGIDFKTIPSPILGIHIHCNSRITSNWVLQEAITLSNLWHLHSGGSVILLGDQKKFLFQAPWAHYHTFPCDWASTGAIILNLNLLVCVDSGPMHLGRAGKINEIVIWGGSGPRDIIGRQPQWFDAMGKVDCVDQICSSCPKGKPLCIESTTANDIWKIISSGGFDPWKPNPFFP